MGITYNGGKGHLWRFLVSQMPPHETYIEPFLGYGSVMRHKAPAALNIGIDLHNAAVNMVATAMGYEGTAATDAWNAWRHYDPTGHAWVFLCVDAVAWLEDNGWKGNELVYVDPPYLMSTRRGGLRRYYEHEMADMDHALLLDLLTELPCQVAVSGYWSEMYADMLSGWRLERVMVQTRQGMAEECVWFNYPTPTVLHDARWIGSGFRERERIKRKKERWCRRLREMDGLERQALLDAITEEGMMGQRPVTHVPGSDGLWGEMNPSLNYRVTVEEGV